VGLAAVFDPLRRKNRSADFVRVASLDAVPADGLPRRFSVLADRADAWSHFPKEAIGAVYLRRTDGHVEALNMICPHLGCPVELDSATECFKCPCHNSAFALTGDVLYGPSPRPMDSLSVDLRGADDAKEVWVKFENFYTAISEKIPIV
jgi:Rieske Fe-S protein